MLTDTQPEAEAVLIKLLRQAPSWRKLDQVGQMNATVRLLLIKGLQQRHPDADESEIQRRLARLLLGQEVAELLYGPLPVEIDNG